MYKSTGVQEYNSSRVQVYKSTKVQEYKSIKILKYKSILSVQKYRGKSTWSIRGQKYKNERIGSSWIYII